MMFSNNISKTYVNLRASKFCIYLNTFIFLYSFQIIIREYKLYIHMNVVCRYKMAGKLATLVNLRNLHFIQIIRFFIGYKIISLPGSV